MYAWHRIWFARTSAQTKSSCASGWKRRASRPAFRAVGIGERRTRADSAIAEAVETTTTASKVEASAGVYMLVDGTFRHPMNPAVRLLGATVHPVLMAVARSQTFR